MLRKDLHDQTKYKWRKCGQEEGDLGKEHKGRLCLQLMSSALLRAIFFLTIKAPPNTLPT